MNNALLFSLAATLFLLHEAKAGDLQSRVVHELQSHGFDRVSAGASLPIETMTECGGRWGETDGKVVRVCERAPEACRLRIVAHELTHVLIARAYGARSDAEGISRAMELIVDTEFKPGCDSPTE